MYKTVAAITVAFVLGSALAEAEAPTLEASALPPPAAPLIPIPEIEVPKIVLTAHENSPDVLLAKAYEVGKADGHAPPEVVQGIILQETNAGAAPNYKVAGPKGDQYYGLGQIKIGAAKDVLRRWPELWKKYGFQSHNDDELRANLILNQPFNIEITSKYLRLLRIQYGFEGRKLVNAYNRGPGGVEFIDNNSFHYALGVERHMSSQSARRARRS